MQLGHGSGCTVSRQKEVETTVTMEQMSKTAQNNTSLKHYSYNFVILGFVVFMINTF